MYRQLPILWLLCSFTLILEGQTNQEGQVVSPRGEPLPFVNIVFDQDPELGTTTDIDGRFGLPQANAVRSLTLTYIGYQDLIIQLDTANTRSPWRIVLQPQTYDFTAVEVIAGDNPADIIMRRVIDNRHRNDPEKLDTYRCQTYNKVVMRWLPGQGAGTDTLSAAPAGERKQKLVESITDHHLFIMESLTERQFRRPARYSETILANKVSGFQAAPFAALANDVQPFSFYQEQVLLMDKAFLNPVSPGSPDRYFFHLEDTLYSRQDTLFLITFHPRQKKNFNGLKGILYVNSHRYALQNIIAEPADTGKIHFRIEQHYDRPDGEHWFPSQLNYELSLPKYPAPDLGLQINGRSYIKKVELNVSLDPKPFRSAEHYQMTDSAFLLPERAWQEYRPEPLDTVEKKTYEIVDSIGRRHHFDRWLSRLEILGQGRWPLGPVDLALSRLLQLNAYEEVRLGLGLYTGERIASWFSAGGYAGYGFKDRKWKFGAEIHFFPDWDKHWEWRWYYRQDIAEAGGQLFPLESDIVSRRLFAGRMDREEAFGTFFRASPVRFLEIGLEVSKSRLQPLYDYGFRRSPEEAPVNTFQFTEAAFHFRYAYGQHYRRILGQRIRIGSEQPYPAVSVSVKKGFGKALDGDFPYWQIQMAADQSFRILRLGKTTYRLEAGYIKGQVPVSRLYNSPGMGRDFQWLTIGDLFQTMDPYEFLSDRYFSLFFRQDFGTLLFKTRWLKPSISIENHFILGNLSFPERHEGFVFDTLEKGYSEAGLIVDDLIRINYLNIAYLGLGAGAYYRYGAYHLSGGIGANMAYRLTLILGF